MSLQEQPLMSAQPPLTSLAAGEDVTRRTAHIQIEFSRLGNSKKVKNSLVTVDADKDLIRVNKKLLDSPELDLIRQADADLMSYINGICLPFAKGVRLVPLVMVEDVTRKIRTHEAKRKLLVDGFMAVYETDKRRAEFRLAALYNPADYPSAEKVRAKFTFDWKFLSFGPPGSLKEVAPEIYAQEREKAAREMSTAVSEITTIMRTTVGQMMFRLQESLTPREDGKQRKLYDSALESLQQFLSTFNLRNVVDDRALAVQVKQAQELLSGVSIEALRTTDSLRDSVRISLEQIGGQIEQLVGTPIRKIRKEALPE
jgi:hypothetical protein